MVRIDGFLKELSAYESWFVIVQVNFRAKKTQIQKRIVEKNYYLRLSLEHCPLIEE